MSSNLPGWIERLLGIEPGTGEGTAWRLEHTWRWPPWITLLAVAVLVAYVVASYVRENPQASRVLRTILAGIRLVVFGLVLAMLAQFALTLQRTGLPYVAVLIDDSLSMSIADRYDEPVRAAIQDRVGRQGFDSLSRWNLAGTVLAERDGRMLREIADNYRLRFYYLTGMRPSEASDPAEILAEIRSAKPAGESTRLGTAIRSVLDELRGSPPAAVVLLTDGINTEGPDLASGADYARRRGVPLYLVGLGDDKPMRDLKLTDLLVDELVFVNDPVYFEVLLSAAGYAGRQVEVVLREQGKKEILAKTGVTLGPDGQSQPVRIPYRPTREGTFKYVVEVEPLEGELQTENNRQEQTVRVRKEKVRVLLVQGEPTYEFRYLRNMLVRDSTIELKTVLQSGDLENAEQDSAALRQFPVQREELFQYDVVVLGDPNPAMFSPSMMQNLIDFVDQPGKGGALVCIAGPKFMPLAYRNTPLARLLPVDLVTVQLPQADRMQAEGFRIEPTGPGLSSPGLQLGETPAQSAEIWRKLPPLYWAVLAPDRKPGVRVLAEFATRDGRRFPAILVQYFGAGKVLFHTMDETRRWRYRMGDTYFARYWVQTLRYLARSKLGEGDRAATLATDRKEYRRGEAVRLRVRFADERLAPVEEDGVTVVLEHQGHPSQRIKLRRGRAGRGVFEAVAENPPIGVCHAWIAIPPIPGKTPSTDFTVTAPPGEFDRIPRETSELRRAAEQTSGQLYTFDNADHLVDELPEGRPVPVESRPPIPLWNTWPVLCLVLLLLVTEWVLRKLGAMV